MNKLLLALVLILIFGNCFAQQKGKPVNWNLTIIDSVTAKSIAWASVSINGKNNYSANISGKININTGFIKPTDSIRISSVGYKTILFIPGKQLLFPDTIRLAASVISLKEVKIRSVNPISLGNIKPSYKGALLPVPGAELVEYIPNKKKIKGTIISLEYVINDGLKGIGMPFMAQLRAKIKDSIYPGPELIKDSVIVYNPNKQRRISVDISKYNIQVPEEGFFVVFEILSPAWYKKDLVWRNGFGSIRVPGLDMDNIGLLAIDEEEKDRKGSKYSLTRTNKAHWEFWTVFTEGNDFAMGVTISP